MLRASDFPFFYFQTDLKASLGESVKPMIFEFHSSFPYSVWQGHRCSKLFWLGSVWWVPYAFCSGCLSKTERFVDHNRRSKLLPTWSRPQFLHLFGTKVEISGSTFSKKFLLFFTFLSKQIVCHLTQLLLSLSNDFQLFFFSLRWACKFSLFTDILELTVLLESV